MYVIYVSDELIQTGAWDGDRCHSHKSTNDTTGHQSPTRQIQGSIYLWSMSGFIVYVWAYASLF